MSNEHSLHTPWVNEKKTRKVLDNMGKHSAKSNATARNTAAAAAVGVGVAVLAPVTAQAAPAVHNPTGFAFDIPNEILPVVQPHLGAVGVSLVGQDAAPAAHGIPVTPFAAPAPSVGQNIANSALSKQGAPYVWGGVGPNGFDCSGLVQWAYAQNGKSIPRTSQAQIAGGTRVAIADIQVGDIVGYYGGNSHVAIYIGDGKVVHAINSGTPVKVTDMYYMPVNSVVRY